MRRRRETSCIFIFTLISLRSFHVYVIYVELSCCYECCLSGKVYVFSKCTSIFLPDILINDENRTGNKFILIVLMMNLIIFVNFQLFIKMHTYYTFLFKLWKQTRLFVYSNTLHVLSFEHNKYVQYALRVYLYVLS